MSEAAHRQRAAGWAARTGAAVAGHAGATAGSSYYGAKWTGAAACRSAALAAERREDFRRVEGGRPLALTTRRGEPPHRDARAMEAVGFLKSLCTLSAASMLDEARAGAARGGMAS